MVPSDRGSNNNNSMCERERDIYVCVCVCVLKESAHEWSDSLQFVHRHIVQQHRRTDVLCLSVAVKQLACKTAVDSPAVRGRPIHRAPLTHSILQGPFLAPKVVAFVGSLSCSDIVVASQTGWCLSTPYCSVYKSQLLQYTFSVIRLCQSSMLVYSGTNMDV